MSYSRRGIARFILVGVLLCVNFLVAPANVFAQGTGSLYFTPTSGQHAVGETFTVSVRVSTGGVSINAAEGSISFDSSKLHVRSLSKSGSIFTLWTTEPTFSNANGTISFGGGLPTPGYNGAGGQVLSIVFQATAETGTGTTNVTLVSGAILANDGNGTNVLATLGRASFGIGKTTHTPTPTPVVSRAGTPHITSSTHPDPSKWYSNPNPAFAWEVPTPVQEVRLVFSRTANSAPFVRYAPPINQKLLTDITDGTWYFRVQFRDGQGLGPIDSFVFHVDTTPPLPFVVTRTDTQDLTNPQPQIVFSTSDITSGIDHYELQIGDGVSIVLPASQSGQGYTLPGQLPGIRTVTVKAFDLAGNATTATLSVTIEPLTAPTITEYPLSVDAGKPFSLRGKGIPGAQVYIYTAPADTSLPTLTSPDDSTGRIAIANVDAQGNWQTTVSGLLPGDHAVYAYSRDDRGALSLASTPVRIYARPRLSDRIVMTLWSILTGLGMFGTWWFVASALFYLILLALLIKLAQKFFTRPPQQAPKERMADSVTSKLDILLLDIESELTLLESISKHRDLYREEDYLKSKLIQYQKTIRQLAKKK